MKTENAHSAEKCPPCDDERVIRLLLLLLVELMLVGTISNDHLVIQSCVGVNALSLSNSDIRNERNWEISNKKRHIKYVCLWYIIFIFSNPCFLIKYRRNYLPVRVILRKSYVYSGNSKQYMTFGGKLTKNIIWLVSCCPSLIIIRKATFWSD